MRPDRTTLPDDAAAADLAHALEPVAGAAWFALRVAPQMEFVARTVLQRRGIEAFLPTHSKWIRQNRHRPGQKKLVRRVLLLGYVLVRLTLPVEWHRLRRIHIITGVVGVAGQPWALPDSGVLRLAQTSVGLDATLAQKNMPTNRVYAAGDMVEIVDGLFDATLPVIELNGRVATVLVEMMGAPRLATIDASRLGAAP